MPNININITNTIKTAVTPTRADDYAQWYQEVVKAADLAENSLVRGCMVIKPLGYAIWENIQKELNERIKESGHQNFYFPMFVPLNLIAKEAKHVEGFAKECAIVTHHKLQMDENNNLVPSGKLEEPLVIRPTSEAIIGEAFSRWIKSYRDLPLLGNQWANVVRWEMRPRMFLRTTEFLWQEGHTAHATADEAIQESRAMLELYKQFIENFLAIPCVIGKKTENEKFPGAITTYCIECMMQDGKSLQAGTSHFLGQNFSKAFNIKFLSAQNREEYAWTTSWGVSTRLIGGLIMTHSDDDGLVLPPKIAPLHVVIIPFIRQNEKNQNIEIKQDILKYSKELQDYIHSIIYNGQNISVKIDISDKESNEKKWYWIKRGVPVRIEIGKRELENLSICISRRDHLSSNKIIMQKDEFIKTNSIIAILNDIQQNLFLRATSFKLKNTFIAKSSQEFFDFFESKKSKNDNTSNNNHFVIANWCGDFQTEDMLKQKFSVTARCVLDIAADNDDSKEESKNIDKDNGNSKNYSIMNTATYNCINEKYDTIGRCIFTGKEGASATLFARSY